MGSITEDVRAKLLSSLESSELRAKEDDDVIIDTVRADLQPTLSGQLRAEEDAIIEEASTTEVSSNRSDESRSEDGARVFENVPCPLFVHEVLVQSAATQLSDSPAVRNGDGIDEGEVGTHFQETARPFISDGAPEIMNGDPTTAPTTAPTTREEDVVNTRILFIADLGRIRRDHPDPASLFPLADVLIVCGGILVDGNHVETLSAQYEQIFDMLRKIPIALKIVVAGSADLTLDSLFWPQMCRSLKANKFLHPSISAAASAAPSVAVVKHANQKDGLCVCLEGTHDFTLPNGGLLRVFTSPYTPKRPQPGRAFTYKPTAHTFNIPTGTDVVVTNGPPLHIMDFGPDVNIHRGSLQMNHAGCPILREAVLKALPPIHCFAGDGSQNGVERGRWLAQGQYKPFVPPDFAPAPGDYFHSNRDDGGMVLQSHPGVKYVDFAPPPMHEGPETLFINPSGRQQTGRFWYVVEVPLTKAYKKLD